MRQETACGNQLDEWCSNQIGSVGAIRGGVIYEVCCSFGRGRHVGCGAHLCSVALGFSAYWIAHDYAVRTAGHLSLPLIGKLLGHTQAHTTMRYAHIDIDPALKAANQVGAAIGDAMRPKTRPTKKVRSKR